MSCPTRFLTAVCAVSLALAFSGCGNKNASVKSTAKATKPAAETKLSDSNKAGQPGAALPGLGSGTGLDSILNPLGSAPPGSGVGTPIKPGPALAPGNKPPAAPVKPISPNVRPEPKQLMAVLQQAYRAAGSMKVEGTSSTTIKMDGKVVGSQSGEVFTTTFKSPDKFIMTSKESSITCDGKNVTIYSPSAKRYHKMPFDQEFARNMVYAKPGVGMMGLAFGMDYMEAIASYKLLKDAKVAGQDTFVLQIKFKKGAGAMANADVTQTLWVGKQDMAIYKNQVVAVEKPVRPKDFQGDFPKTVETTIVGTVTKFTANPKLADSAFAFKAPAGAKPVEPPKEINLIGKAAPDFSFTASDGSRQKLSDLQGKPVMLVFWAMPMPEDQVKLLQSAYTEHKDDTQIVAINLNPEPDKIREFMKSKGYSLPLLFGDEAIARVAMEKYGIRGVPSMLLIDKSGTVRLATIGIPEPDDLTAKLAKYTPGN